MSNLVKQDNSLAPSYTPEQIQLIKDTICRGATDDELKYFIYVANKTGLDPMSRQIYSVGRWDSKLGREVRAIQVSIDGFRVVAERSGKYAGQLGPYYCGVDGQWTDIWLHKEPPVAAKVGVLRSDFKEPLWAIAKWDSYCQKTKDGRPTQFWMKMPELMLGKVAESLALRKAFPQDLSGIYSQEEMAQAEAVDEPKKQDYPTGLQSSKAIQIDDHKKAKDDLIAVCAQACQGLTTQEKMSWINNVLGIPNMKELDRLSTERIRELGMKVSASLVTDVFVDVPPPSDSDYVPEQLEMTEEPKQKSVKNTKFRVE